MNEFFNLILAESSAPGAISFQELLLRLLISFLARVSVAYVYRISHSALNYSLNFGHVLGLLSRIVAGIMCGVGDSLARAFGLGLFLLWTSPVRFDDRGGVIPKTNRPTAGTHDG